ncbi:heme o synthase [Paenibacillus chartarius]|uniref:Protoheme IX farnesyltransferase n=1 Tax=Paenibacillus chartarius TaxID=747481 RepID=A0ABV6DF06_9BACL
MNNPISIDAAGSPAAETAHVGDQDATMTKTQQRATLRDYIQLTKPGIVFHNLITAFGGFWVASRWELDWLLLILTMLGTALIVASGCALNNYLDRELDAKMARTQERALVTGKLTPGFVLGFGLVLGAIGTVVLGMVNILTALLGVIGMILYVWVYTMMFKRTSVWSTFVGSFSGAVPPVMGYVAVTNTMDAGAWILFLILFLWQPPHFWALGIRRVEEYRAAGFPLLPVVRGSFVTKISMVRYVVLLVPVSMLLYFYGYVGEVYMFAAAGLGLIWALMCLQGFQTKDTEEENKWAKKMFVYSINYLTILIILMVVTTTHAV